MPAPSSPRVVLVTGCSKGGIGHALCEGYAKQGCIVYATARRLESMTGFSNSNIRTMKLDVLDDQNMQDVVKTVIEKEGRIDILVNNAGALAAGAILDQTPVDVHQAFQTNTFSVLRLTQLVLPHMAERHSGTVVNIGSIVGEIPTPWNGLYSATKSAVHTISEILWMECKPFNVNVVLVAPGGVKSNIAKNQEGRWVLPEGSLYKDYVGQIMRRIRTSQGEGSLESAEFARRVVRETMKERPGRYLTLGRGAGLWVVLKWLPRTLVLWALWRMFSRP